MHTNIAAGPAAKRSRKTRLWTAQHVDGRTRGAKRARAIAAELARGWDGMTPVQRQMLDRAAMLTALSEDLLARRLAGAASVVRRATASRGRCEASCSGRSCRAAGATGATAVLADEGPTGRGRKEGAGEGSSGGCYREGTAG
jgi:hypothetical protein